MSYLDLQARPAAPETDGPSFAEPPAMLPGRDENDWFDSLEAGLHDADVVRVAGSEWLRPDALRQRVEAILRRLEHRGVRIERDAA